MASILDSYPEYASTARLDDIRRDQYGYLDEQNHVYLDYTGSGLAARAQHKAHAQHLATQTLGNPHSVSPTSALATELVEAARARVLQHFNASPAEYVAIFTPNATGAARLVGESYQYRTTRAGRPKLVITYDNHNSLIGLREFARRQGVDTTSVPSVAPDMHIDPQVVMAALGPVGSPDKGVAASAPVSAPASAPSASRNHSRRRRPVRAALNRVFCGMFGSEDHGDDTPAEKPGPSSKEAPPSSSPSPSTSSPSSPRVVDSDATITDDADADDAGHAHDHSHERGLFVYPAQSNFSGARHPLTWVAEAQRRGYDVLLDTAAYLPTAQLDLARHHPDFLLVSWYKLFGYPTGLGCLVARREALSRLERPWFAGGTIRAVGVRLDWHTPSLRTESQFEDGTVNFQAIPEIITGLDWLARDVGFGLLSTRVRCVTAWFLDRLVALRHTNGQPMVRLYGSSTYAADGSTRGSTVAFNFLDPTGRLFDERIVGAEAARARISLRTGCFCNPGAGEIALGFSDDQLRAIHQYSLMPPAAVADKIDAAQKNNSSSGSSSDDVAPSLDADDGLPVAGAVRVSFGVASNAADVDRFFVFAEHAFRDRVADNRNLGPRGDC